MVTVLIAQAYGCGTYGESSYNSCETAPVSEETQTVPGASETPVTPGASPGQSSTPQPTTTKVTQKMFDTPSHAALFGFTLLALIVFLFLIIRRFKRKSSEPD